MPSLRLMLAASALALTPLVAVAPVAAQSHQDQFEVAFQARETQRRATISRTMAFTEKEAEQFWPIYDQYRIAAKRHQLQRARMIVRLAENTVGMDQATASSLIKTALKLEKDQQAAKQVYIEQLGGHFSGARHFRLYQLETKLDALFRYGWTKQIPLAVTEDELQMLQSGLDSQRAAEMEAAERARASLPTT